MAADCLASAGASFCSFFFLVLLAYVCLYFGLVFNYVVGYVREGALQAFCCFLMLRPCLCVM